MDDITFLADENDYTAFPEGKPKTLVRYSKVRFVCSQCGREKTISYGCLSYPFVCRNCRMKNKAGDALKTRKRTLQEKYGVDNVFQADSVKEKIKRTCVEKYGVEYASQSDAFKKAVAETNTKNFGVPYLMQSEINREKSKNTCREKYGTDNVAQCTDIKEKIRNTNKERYGVYNAFQCKEIQERQRQTCVERYGVENPGMLKSIQAKRVSTVRERYGVDYAIQNHDILAKARKKYKYLDYTFDSAPEIAYYIWLSDNNISFTYQPDIRLEYVFDGKKCYYHPDFLVDGRLTEIKGPQFFEDCDPGRKMVNPFNHADDDKFEAKHQCMLANGVNIVTDYAEYIDYVERKYTADFIPLFRNGLKFPYPNSDLSDRSDSGVIRHFHKSVYDARRHGFLSPREAWEDKDLVLRSALNRLKYVGRCTPSDILQGFNIAKIAPKVSVFNPALATRLISSYLMDCETVFDPFSGFSGRMLGADNCGKAYIGQDINQAHVDESNAIITYRGMKDCAVVRADSLAGGGEYDCLFTCPPYGDKESWNVEETVLECDSWIDACLEKYRCRRYLFVVDKTVKYVDNIVETITNRSHFGVNTESAVLIAR